jgi:hypothetical protein
MMLWAGEWAELILSLIAKYEQLDNVDLNHDGLTM